MSHENKIFVKAKSGALIRRHDTLKPISAEGEYVPYDSYYRRAIAAGDLEACEAPKETQAKANNKKDN